MQHFSGGGRHSLHTTTTGRVSYYPRSPNLANGHPHHGGGARPGSKRLPAIGNPASTIGYGNGWGSSSAPSSAVRATGGIQQQHKHAYERKQYQSKQPLGTGGNRASLGVLFSVNISTLYNFRKIFRKNRLLRLHGPIGVEISLTMLPTHRTMTTLR